MKTVFHDRHERRQYLKACETARRIASDQGLIANARHFVETVMAPDLHQQVYTSMWRELLNEPAENISAALIEDSDRGQLPRDTAPIFGKGYTSREIAALLDRDRAAPR